MDVLLKFQPKSQNKKMEKLAKRNRQTSPKSLEVIEANKNHEPSSWKIIELKGAGYDNNFQSVSRNDGTWTEGAGYGHQINCNSQKEDPNSSSSSYFLSSSSTSSDLMEDASSSSSCSSSSNGPLFQLSDLLAQLPIKRGLSKYYQGKSQSFTTLANVERLEDLPKREKPFKKKKNKLCKSYNCGKNFSPKATISKKPSSRA